MFVSKSFDLYDLQKKISSIQIQIQKRDIVWTLFFGRNDIDLEKKLYSLAEKIFTHLNRHYLPTIQ